MKRILLVFSIVLIAGFLLSGCFLFGEKYEPGDQMGDGAWYAEHDYGLGNRTVKGVIDGSAIEWEEAYMNEVSYTLIRHYDDGTEVDLLADVRDENGLLRMACHEEDGSFVISGLPSWELTDDSYVRGEIVNYGGSEEGQPEAFQFLRTFSTEELSEETTIDIGTYKLKPINSVYSLTFDFKYMYRGEGSDYVEKTYEEATSLGFELTGGNWAGGSGVGEGIYAYLLKNVTDADVQAGKIVLDNCIAGGEYKVGATISVDGNLMGKPNPPVKIAIDAGNPTPTVDAYYYLD